jgi:hypothetical protein
MRCYTFEGSTLTE